MAVPERSIGGSFASTRLVDNGFFAYWEVEPPQQPVLPGKYRKSR